MKAKEQLDTDIERKKLQAEFAKDGVTKAEKAKKLAQARVHSWKHLADQAQEKTAKELADQEKKLAQRTKELEAARDELTHKHQISLKQ